MCVWVGGGRGGGGGGGWLNLRVIHTLFVRSFLKTWPKKKLQSPVVGNDSGACKASFAGDVPRMFSLIKNEGDSRHKGTVVVFTINHADWRLGVVCFVTPLALHVKSKFFGFWEEYGRKLKPERNDGGTTRSGVCGVFDSTRENSPNPDIEK